MLEHPFYVLTVLLVVLAALFGAARHALGQRVFRVVPLLVFAYFVPTVLSNTGVIPLASPLYTAIKVWLLPASLVLLTLSVDVPAILKLGRKALIMFAAAVTSIVVGGPLAYLALGWMVPAGQAEQTWKGLAALAGSWIGGGANFVAIAESVGTSVSTLGMMVVVDVAVASVWMAVLLYFAGRSNEMDARAGADASAIDALRERVEAFRQRTASPTSLAALLGILAVAASATAVATALSTVLPPIGDIIGPFTWVVILVTTLGLLLSFTPVRKLEGHGASALGSVFLYLLVASIGARAELDKIFDAPALVAIGALWMIIHAATILAVRRAVRAPIFLGAVGSQACVGGAASAPIVASAFHPSLAPVGVLLAIAGYVLGTYLALVCAYLLELVSRIYA